MLSTLQTVHLHTISIATKKNLEKNEIENLAKLSLHLNNRKKVNTWKLLWHKTTYQFNLGACFVKYRMGVELRGKANNEIRQEAERKCKSVSAFLTEEILLQFFLKLMIKNFMPVWTLIKSSWYLLKDELSMLIGQQDISLAAVLVSFRGKRAISTEFVDFSGQVFI